MARLGLLDCHGWARQLRNEYPPQTPKMPQHAQLKGPTVMEVRMFSTYSGTFNALSLQPTL